jgi:hypothetical protein
MADQPDDPPEAPEETPIQRALRLKKAAIAGRPAPPRGGKFQRQQSARAKTGQSKPWMTR